MMRKLAIGTMLLLLSMHGGEAVSISAVSNGSLDADRADGTQVAPPTNPAASVQVVVPPPAPVAPASERALSANPLWAIPLAQLPNTRDRPIFSPSRRPCRKWPRWSNQGSLSVRRSLWSAQSQATMRDSGYFWINLPRRSSGSGSARTIRAGSCDRFKAGKRHWKRINGLSPSRCRSPALDRWPLRSLRRWLTSESCCR